MKPIPYVSWFPKRIVRFEPLEERTLLSSAPGCFTPVAEESPSYSLAAASSATPYGPIDVSGVFDDLWDDSSESASEESTSEESTQSQDQPEIVPNFFSVLDSDELSDDVVDSLASSSASGGGSGGTDASGGGSGGSDFSGGVSGGEGRVLTPVCSGGFATVGNDVLGVEGSSILFTISGSASGDSISPTISHGSTDANDVSLNGLAVNDDAQTGSVAYTISINSDQVYGEGDEDFTVNFTVISGSATLSRSSFHFIIVERPELVSDVDSDTPHMHDQADVYRAYVRSDAEEGTPFNMYTTIGIEQNGLNGSTSDVRYELVFQENNYWADESNYFQIDPQSGVISLKKSASDIIEDVPFLDAWTYSFNLTVKAYRESYRNLSGGDAFCDTAAVTVAFSHWFIYRKSSKETCEAIPNDGCTIADLAHEIGLDASEFNEWLTIDNQNPGGNSGNNSGNNSGSDSGNDSGNDLVISVFTSDKTITVGNLNAGTVLAENTTSAKFSIPNTIYAAYCYDPSKKNPPAGETPGEQCIRWDYNISRLEALGFHVVQFNNSDYTATSVARNKFLSDIKDLSTQKRLQGLYLVGHGYTGTLKKATAYYFGIASGSQADWGETWGPRWSVYYNQGSLDSIGHRLSYKLGAVVIQACFSDNPSSNSLLSATSTATGNNVVFFGSKKEVQAGFLDVASFWNQKKQGTNDLSTGETQ